MEYLRPNLGDFSLVKVLEGACISGERGGSNAACNSGYDADGDCSQGSLASSGNCENGLEQGRLAK
ncbi:MAG: hypothetical protein HQ564_00095 [Candidatus Saganbacteria bacterium]|nr:hypothetical protein [Candidatus Saganbacteria bacterium]